MDEKSQIVGLESIRDAEKEILCIECACGHIERIEFIEKYEEAGGGMQKITFHCPKCEPAIEQ
jgi:hypothetical protein